MAELTSQQRRQLDELAGELARDNPRLARALAGRWYALRRQRITLKPCRSQRGHVLDWVAISLLLAAPLLLSLGVMLAQPVLLLLGAAAMINGPALLTVARTRWPPAV